MTDRASPRFGTSTLDRNDDPPEPLMCAGCGVVIAFRTTRALDGLVSGSRCASCSRGTWSVA